MLFQLILSCSQPTNLIERVNFCLHSIKRNFCVQLRGTYSFTWNPNQGDLITQSALGGGRTEQLCRQVSKVALPNGETQTFHIPQCFRKSVGFPSVLHSTCEALEFCSFVCVSVAAEFFDASSSNMIRNLMIFGHCMPLYHNEALKNNLLCFNSFESSNESNQVDL
jgi:hypothetical protein